MSQTLSGRTAERIAESARQASRTSSAVRCPPQEWNSAKTRQRSSIRTM
jgi:CelD/BcsL family acetyltransferase involved in cellulose biosynthesis